MIESTPPHIRQLVVYHDFLKSPPSWPPGSAAAAPSVVTPAVTPTVTPTSAPAVTPQVGKIVSPLSRRTRGPRSERSPFWLIPVLIHEFIVYQVLFEVQGLGYRVEG